MNCKVCGNTSAKNTSVSFFRFPKENSKCRDWADRCDLLGLFEKHGTVRFHKSFRICSQHFDPKYVVFDGRKNRLLESATPQMSTFAKNPSIQEDVKNLNFQLPQNLCRLCAEEHNNVTDIFGCRGRLLKLEKKLKYFPQVINKHDILPLKICNDCVSKVNHFYDFILNCTRAETKLRAMLDAKDCGSSGQLIKSAAESDDNVNQHSGMETSSNETPNFPNAMTCFPQNMTGNYCESMLMESFISDDKGGYLSKSAEEGFATKNHLYTHTNLIEVEFSNNITFEHDYSNMMPSGQLQPETEMQEPDDRSFILETKFSCDRCLESFQSYDALNAHFLTHSEKWDLHRNCLNELYDEVFCSRPCQSRRESETKARLKRFLKCDQTKPSSVRELNQTHPRPKRPSCRFWERFLKKRVRLSQEKTQTEESHQCTQCGKFFRSKASLRQHRSVHSEKRMHNCQECGTSFKRKDTLYNHLRIHTGERPFMCKVCGFAFKQKGDCMKHEKNHNKYGDSEPHQKGSFKGRK